MAGKSHLGSDDSGKLTELGFDKAFFKHSDGNGHWNMDINGKDIPPQVQAEKGTYHLELITTWACAFIERYKQQPFFFYLAYRAPHVPLDAPKKYTDRFPGPMPDSRRKALGAISCVDDGVGRIMETLRKNGLEENTLVFFLGDNGAPLKMTKPDGGNGWDGSLNDPLNGEKGTLIEGGIRTPFLVYWKGTIPGGQVYPHPVISLDIAATANAIAGNPADPQFDGTNLMPYLTGKNSAKPHDKLFWAWENQYAVRRGDWKLLFSGNRQYLFNIANDPEEKHNMLAQNAELAKNLRTEVEQWSKGLIPPGIGNAPILPAANKYYDFYLDGKRGAAVGGGDDESEDAPPKAKGVRRKKVKGDSGDE